MEKIENFIKSNLPNFKLLYFFLKSEGHDHITVSFNIQSGEIDYSYYAYGRGQIKLPERLKDFYEKLVNIVTEEDFNIDYAINGQKGIAKFVKDKLLKDDNGKPLYICTDTSRQIFKYKDNKGDIKKDVEAKKLTEYIVDGGIKKKTVDVASEWYVDDGGIDMEKFDIMMNPQQSILKLNDDNTVFKKELASLTS